MAEAKLTAEDADIIGAHDDYEACRRRLFDAEAAYATARTELIHAQWDFNRASRNWWNRWERGRRTP